MTSSNVGRQNFPLVGDHSPLSRSVPWSSRVLLASKAEAISSPKWTPSRSINHVMGLAYFLRGRTY